MIKDVESRNEYFAHELEQISDELSVYCSIDTHKDIPKESIPFYQRLLNCSFTNSNPILLY